MILARDELCALIPHAGSMCLLDGVEQWDDDGIVCSSLSHRRADHPLRTAAGLGAIHGVEYGAQAMAVHGGLLARRAGQALPAGYLAALRDVRLHAARLDGVDGPLRVSAARLLAEGGNLVYRIEVHGEEQLMVEARVTVVKMGGGAQ
jgi:predicted hotdog family 3-hydroxylacyl-ACP dehydratase